MNQRNYASDGLLFGPPPTVPCSVCQERTQRQAVSTPFGWAWQCRRCMTVSDEHRYEFDLTVAPEGKSFGLRATRTLQQLIIGLRNSQEGPLDPEDLYLVIAPYFRAGWCIRDVHHGLNYLPNGELHPDTGWTDRLPRKQLLYRVKNRLWAWRWTDRYEDDDIMEGGWTAMRNAMMVAARRQQEHRVAVEDVWHRQRQEARATGDGPGRQAARAVAAEIAARSRRRRAAAEAAERMAAQRRAAEAMSPLYLSQVRAEAGRQ